MKKAIVGIEFKPDFSTMAGIKQEIAKAVREGIQQGGGRVSGSGGAGGGKGGGKGTSGDLSNKRARLQADMDVARAKKDIKEQGKLRAEMISLGKEQSTKAYVSERIQIGTTARLQDQTAKRKAAQDRAAQAQQRAAHRENLAAMREEARMLTGVDRLKKQREIAEARFAGNPRLPQVLQGYDKRIAAMQNTPQQQRGGLMGGFLHGWNKAGGVSEALGTVAKYMLVYKAIDIPLQAVNTTINAGTQAVRGSIAAWADYEEQMASVSRTVRQPGVSNDTLKGVMGRDALAFMEQYRVSMAQTAQAEYELGSAGFTATQALQAYQVPLKLAVGLQSDVTQTTRLLTQMLKIHGEQMGSNLTDYQKMVRIGAVVARTWEIEQVELDDLATAYKYVAGTATAMKLPVEQLVPLMGFLSTYGQRGSTGGTGLNQFFTQMARTIEITDEQITKLQKSARGMEHVINFKPGQYTPFDLLIKVSEAGAKAKIGDVGWAKLTKAFSDMFNMRGARPAMLLADMGRLRDLMKNIGEVTGMTTAKAEQLVQRYVDLMQNTPLAQWDLARNKIYSLGVEFVTASGGADTLVDSLKNLNSWLAAIKPVVIDIGFRVHREGLELLRGYEAWSGAPQGTKEKIPFIGAYNRYARGATQGAIEGYGNEYKARLKRRLSDKYVELIGKGKTPTQAINALEQIVKNEDKSFSTQTNALMDELNPAPYLDFGLSRKKWTPQDLPTHEASRRINAIQNLQKEMRGGGRWWLKNLVGATPEQQRAQRNVREAELEKYLQQMGLGADYQGTSRGAGGGSGKGGGSEDPYKAGSSILGYKVSRGWTPRLGTTSGTSHFEKGVFDVLLSEIRRKGKTKEQALADFWAAGYVPVYRPANKKWAAHLHIADPYQAPKEAARLRKQMGLAPGRGYIMDSQTGKLVQAGLSPAGQFQSLTDISDAAARSAMSTVQDLLTMQQMTRMQALGAYNKIALKQGPFRHVSLGTEAQVYSARKDIWQDIKRNSREAIGFMRDMRGFYRGRQDEVDTRSLDAYDRKLSAIEERESLYGETLDSVSRKIDNRKAKTGEMLNQLETQKQRLTAAQAQYSQDSQKLGQQYLVGLMTGKLPSDISDTFEDVKRSSQDVDTLTASVTKLEDSIRSTSAASTKLALDLNKTLADSVNNLVAEIKDFTAASDEFAGSLNLRMRRAGAEGLTGKDRIRALIGIDRDELQQEVDAMYTDHPERSAEIDAFHAYMDSQIGVGYWRDARERIVDEWTGMFQEMYSALSTGDNPWKAVDSIVRSVQGQMISGWTKRTFGGWFDMLASKETGIGVASSGTSGGAVAAVGASIGMAAGKEIVKTAQNTAQSGNVPAAGSKGGMGKDLAMGLQNYATGNMFASMLGGMMGYDPTSAGVAGGLGYAAGLALHLNPLGAGLLGLASIFGFGKKKKKPKPDPNRDIYGMPSFEYESYMYHLYEQNSGWEPVSSRSLSGAPTVANNTSVGQIVININGGDEKQVRQTVNDALRANFGAMAQVVASSGGRAY